MEELDLKELFTILWNKKIEIILIILMFLALGIVYTYIIVEPVYSSSTTLVLATSKSSGNTETSITQTDIDLNSNLVSTYSELIKSKLVLREVIDNLNKEGLTEEGVKKGVFVTSVQNTELIQINVTNNDPNIAAEVANEIAKVFSNKIVEIYNISNVYIVDKAEASEIPSNINHIKDLLIFTFIGIIISVAFVLILNMLDNTVKNEEDIEKLTGLLVLTAIPEYDTEVNKRKGGKRV